MNFIHLQNHSYYSLLQALPSPKKLAAFAKEKNMKAIALTDSGNLYGALEFYLACKKEGVKAILGCEMFIAPRSLHKKENRADGRPYNMLFLAENNEGYKNLTRLSTISYLEGMYYKPRIDYDVIEKNKKGLIAIDSGRYTKLANLIIENGSEEEIENLIKKHLEIFGEDNYYFGILDHKNTPVQLDLNDRLREYGKKFGVKCVALQNSFYLNPEDAEVQDVVTCIATGRNLDDGRRASMIDEDYSLKDPEDMIKAFEGFPDEIKNTEKIANRCNVSFETGIYRIPDFPPDEKAKEKYKDICEINTPIEYFRIKCIEGLKDRYPKYKKHLEDISWKNLNESTIDNLKIDLTAKSKRDQDDIDNSMEKELSKDPEKEGLRIAVRFEHEFKIIQKMGFESYFLMVSDYCIWSWNNDIMVGPGRGSGAGSIIAFAMKITNIEPLRYGLLFERFLNPERVSMPDFDIDFEDDKRMLVVDYVSRKYGKDHVAVISTFGTMAARAAIKDVGRTYGVGFADMNEFAKLIPEKPGTKLGEAREEEAPLRAKVESEDIFKRVWDSARILEGNVRHISVHACAVVISDKPLENYTALQYAPKNADVIISQFSAKPLEQLGLLKMDFLGLKNLTILKNAKEVIKQSKGIDVEIDKIPIHDKKTLELFQRGETTGIFQFESGGMKKYLKELAPTRFEDLIAMNSLYRPGPMEYIPTFIKGKHHPSTVKYPHESLEEILKETYGIAVYQEQILQIAQIFAGYSLGQADLLRRAIGKKIQEEMDRQRGVFIKKAIEVGREEKLAEHIFDDIIVPFAGYGFNKCLTKDTEVQFADGKILNIGEIREKILENKNNKKNKNNNLDNNLENFCENNKILSLNEENFLFEEDKIIDIHENGVKEIFELNLINGKKIKSTINHNFLTDNGWKELGDLKKGDFLIVPKKIEIKNNSENKNKSGIGILGYLLAEGNLCHPSGSYFYSSSKEEILDILKLAENFGDKNLKIGEDKKNLEKTGKINYYIYFGKNSKVNRMIENFGLKGENSYSKKIPEEIFTENNEEISYLVAKMWQGDGHISQDTFYYATSSEKIAKQIVSLLLRFGISSNLTKKFFDYKDGRRGFTITVFGLESKENFKNFIGKYLIGEKKNILEKIIFKKDCKNIYPQEKILEEIKKSLKKFLENKKNILKYGKNFGIKNFAEEFGFAERLFFSDKNKKGYTKDFLEKLNKILKNEFIQKILDGDILFEEILEIKKIGEEETFDLEIEKNHNFIANNIITHNSHAAAYSLIAYQTAYLKAHFPTEFMAALLMSDKSNADRVAIEIQECNKIGIDVLPPDVNESFENFTVVGEGKIRFGLSAIKNLGDNGIEAIIKSREKDGKYTDITDFISRLDYTHLNKKNFEAMILCGALDCLGERNSLHDSMLEMIEFSKEKGKEKDSGQMDLFGMMDIGGDDLGEDVSKFKLREVAPADIETRLDWEKEYLGLFVSQHPLAGLENYIMARTYNLENLTEKELKSDKLKSFAGLITGLRIIRTKKGENFSVFDFETPQGNFEAVFFPKFHAKIKNRIAEGKSFLIKGKIKQRNGSLQIVGEELIKLKIEELRKHAAEQNILGDHRHFQQKEVVIPILDKDRKKEWTIKIPYSATENHMAKLKEMLLANSGETTVTVILPQGKEVEFPKGVDANGKLRSDVLELFRKSGEEL